MAKAKRTTQRVLMEEMTSAEVAEVIAKGTAAVLIISASTEASGPHLVLGKHIFRMRYLAERIARELGDTLVAPVIPFAPVTDEARFPGTMHLTADTFYRINQDAVESMAKAGFRNIILMGDHDGNQQPLKSLAEKMDKAYRRRGTRVFYSSDAYYKSNREIDAYLKERGFPESRHGGIADTSTTMALGKNYVRLKKIARGEAVPPEGSALRLGGIGVEGDPRRSSLRLGRMFLELKVRNAIAEIRRMIESNDHHVRSATMKNR
jgi:creatinine amidohydrolase/Fe(II)-dependent formamide hydrolase-like protein